MRLFAALLLALALPSAAWAQTGSGSGSSGSSPSRGGSSGSAKTEQAPGGALRSHTTNPGPDTHLGAPGSGVAPGSSGPAGRGMQQQSRVPDECAGVGANADCGTAAAPTGTGLGDRGTAQGERAPYGPAQSPVQGGPPFTGPTGRPLALPEEGR
jgi:hypothetical protein